MNDTGHLSKYEQGIENCKLFESNILPELKVLFDVKVLYGGTKQTRFINRDNGKKVDYYPHYRKINDFQYKNWMILANDGEINTVIKILLR